MYVFYYMSYVSKEKEVKQKGFETKNKFEIL